MWPAVPPSRAPRCLGGPQPWTVLSSTHQTANLWLGSEIAWGGLGTTPNFSLFKADRPSSGEPEKEKSGAKLVA